MLCSQKNMNSVRRELICELIIQQNEIKRQIAELRKQLGQNNSILEQMSELEIARNVVENGITKEKGLRGLQRPK